MDRIFRNLSLGILTNRADGQGDWESEGRNDSKTNPGPSNRRSDGKQTGMQRMRRSTSKPMETRFRDPFANSLNGSAASKAGSTEPEPAQRRCAVLKQGQEVRRKIATDSATESRSNTMQTACK
jgi:hypothetical protein